MRNPNMPTLSLAEINHPDAVVGEFVTYFLSGDDEAENLAGFGKTEEESETVARKNIHSPLREIPADSLVTFQVA